MFELCGMGNSPRVTMPSTPSVEGSGDSWPREGLAMTVTAGEPPVVDLLGLAIAEARHVRRRGPVASSTPSPTRSPCLSAIKRERSCSEIEVVWTWRCRSYGSPLRLAARCGDPDRQADVRATLGVALAMAGRTGIRPRAAGPSRWSGHRPCRRRRRSSCAVDTSATSSCSNPREALADLERALPRLRAAGEHVWEARTLNLIGLCHLALGHAERAAAAVESAERIFVMEGQHVESVVTLHNRGRHRLLPAATCPPPCACTTRRPSGTPPSARIPRALVIDQCEALLAAGLAHEAARSGDSASVGAVSLPADRAGGAAVEPGAWQSSRTTDPADAVASATRARQLFRQAASRVVGDSSRSSSSCSRAASRGRGGRLPREVRRPGGERAGRAAAPSEAAVAWLLAGQHGSRQRGSSSAAELLERAATFRHRPAGLVRATGWQARALGTRAARRLARRARRVPAWARRARRAPRDARQLRAAGAGDPARGRAGARWPCGTPRTADRACCWSGASAGGPPRSSQPPVHPPDDDELARSLAALRDTRRRLAEARAEGSPTAAGWTTSGRGSSGRSGGVRTTSRAPRPRRTRFRGRGRSSTSLDGTGVRRARRRRRGAARPGRPGGPGHPSWSWARRAEAEQAVAFARFALRQTARGRPSDLDDVGRRLQVALLGDAVRRLGDGPVVVSPPGRLHATPWALVPALTDVPVSVAPFGRPVAAGPGVHGTVGRRVLIAGPGLESGGAELDTLAAASPRREAAPRSGRHGRAEPGGARRRGGRARRGARAGSARTARSSRRSTSTTGR